MKIKLEYKLTIDYLDPDFIGEYFDIFEAHLRNAIQELLYNYQCYSSHVKLERICKPKEEI